MKLTEYKTTTLAREDVDDIVKVEPVEMRPNADKSAYEQVVHVTELGKTLRKYDVHLMRVVGGVKQFVKEHLVVINEGEVDEEVVFTAPTTEVKTTNPSAIEDYVFKHANNTKYQNKQITEMNLQAPWVRFMAVKDNNDGTGVVVTCFAYMKAGVPTTIELTNQ